MTADTTFKGVSASPDPADLSGGVLGYDAVESDTFGNSVSTSVRSLYLIHDPTVSQSLIFLVYGFNHTSYLLWDGCHVAY